jgi:anti-sigma B factor antagonist
MKITHEDNGHVCVLNLAGELTEEYVADLDRFVKDKVEDNIRDFVVNMEESEYVDSKGLEMLLAIQDHCSDQLGQIRLASVNDSVSEILRITRLAGRFEQHDDVESAMSSLRL